MFSKGVILVFLLLGLSSSIAHAIPHQDRAAQNPCDDTSKKPATDLTSSSMPSNVPQSTPTSTGKGSKTTDNTKKVQAAKAANGDNKNNTGGTGNNNDPNSSLCLDQTVLAKGSESDGLKNASAGTSASLTSTNNFINFCTGKTITNGQQVKAGSCNPIPMGSIASAQNIPSCKYVFPKNLDTLKANTAFTMKLAVKNAQLGVFTNAQSNYYAAPQQLNAQGNIIGHTHLVVEQVQSLSSTDPLDATKFAFFKGIDGPAAADGTVTADVTAGLPEGVYRFMTIGTSANHVPFLVAVAQHGSMEDAVYATVTADGNPSGNNNNTGAAPANTNPKTKGKGGKNTGNDNSTTTSQATPTATGKDKPTPSSKGVSAAVLKGKDNSTTPCKDNSTATDNKKSADNAPKSANGKTTRGSSRSVKTFGLTYRKD